jgi:hypothetical protein
MFLFTYSTILTDVAARACTIAHVASHVVIRAACIIFARLIQKANKRCIVLNKNYPIKVKLFFVKFIFWHLRVSQFFPVNPYWHEHA